jgi:hypothetical protein
MVVVRAVIRPGWKRIKFQKMMALQRSTFCKKGVFEQPIHPLPPFDVSAIMDEKAILRGLGNHEMQ